MGRIIYLDNAATTFPKPECVYKRMDYVNRNLAVNAGRGSYELAREATEIIDCTRDKLCKLVNGRRREDVILTPSVTVALNQILGGIVWEEHSYVYVSPFEHNAVVRTLYNMADQYNLNIVEMPVIIGENDLKIDLDRLEYMFSKCNPFCVCMTHVSNVTGNILPILSLCRMAKKYNAITILDAAQSLGLIPIDLRKVELDYLAFAGHKTLYGPFGVGGFVINNVLALKSYIAGGTGSDSLNVNMPNYNPVKYEPASQNIVAIAGLEAALAWISKQEDLLKREKEKTDYLYKQLSKINDIIVYSNGSDEHIGIISFNVCGYTADEVGDILDHEYNIAVRTGYHCAPLIHRHLKEDGFKGTVRIGIGCFNTKEELDILVSVLKELT